jgi:hypothetical protein
MLSWVISAPRVDEVCDSSLEPMAERTFGGIHAQRASMDGLGRSWVSSSGISCVQCLAVSGSAITFSILPAHNG